MHLLDPSDPTRPKPLEFLQVPRTAEDSGRVRVQPSEDENALELIVDETFGLTQGPLRFFSLCFVLGSLAISRCSLS